MFARKVGELYDTDKGFFIDPSWIGFIEVVRHKPGWAFDVQSDMLLITLGSLDAYDLRVVKINTHNFPLPPRLISHAEKSLYVLECIIKVEIHEARESFEVGGVRRFAPTHTTHQDNYAMPRLA